MDLESTYNALGGWWGCGVGAFVGVGGGGKCIGGEGEGECVGGWF